METATFNRKFGIDGTDETALFCNLLYQEYCDTGILPVPCLQLGEASSGIYKIVVYMHLFASTDEGPILRNSEKILPSSVGKVLMRQTL